MKIEKGQQEVFISFSFNPTMGFNIRMSDDGDIDRSVIVSENATIEEIAKAVIEDRKKELQYYQEQIEGITSQIEKIENWLESREQNV